jgi:hypothetical protein
VLYGPYLGTKSPLHPLRLAERLPSARLVGTRYLPDWSLRFHKVSKDESGKCGILPGGAGVYFAIFDISDYDKLALDRIEGVSNGCAAIALDIPPFGNCASYRAEASHLDESLRPYDWYRELVVAGTVYHGFPDNYVARIKSVPAVRGPDTKRSASQWALAERLRVRG